ncbi:hypothetical protein GEU84_009180 [Fertoebacter nigrum]|uniref:Thiol:disulfide interchange protein DsbD N-terminal domain-containing protein n=1 Tax=Fertoeibacter niger TaxID=2656921 RepID=A0A8X8H1P3_9RHOB|nr:hypothetical protein [Fertoeibacter niger]NUB44552.1 hypothetical protein [Fertoeibacter niger]
MRHVAIVLAAALCGIAQVGLAQDTTFYLDLRFDPAALERLSAMGERVMVSAWYHGDPSSPDVAVDEIGQVFLGAEQAEVWPGNQTLRLGGMLAGAPLAQVSEARVNINVFTARLVHEDNLLDCSLVDGPMSEVQAGKPGIFCTLLAP